MRKNNLNRALKKNTLAPGTILAILKNRKKRGLDRKQYNAKGRLILTGPKGGTYVMDGKRKIYNPK